jgi:phage terminase large subunit-like protein
MVREGLQRLLFGIGGAPGFVPEDLIVKTSVVPNSGGMIDEAYIKHRCGGISRLAFKSYDQGRERWQAGTVDGIAFDEEPPEDIYMEGITRTNATNGPVMLTFTPLQGMSNVVKRFLLDVSSEGAKYRNVTRMTIYDVDHYTDEERARIIATYPEHERKARTMGEPSLGAGAIFPINEEVLKVLPFAIPHHWKRIVGIDFGWNHPFAAAWLAYDADTDTIYVTDCYKVREATPIIHAATIKGKGDWIPVSWPHDGLQHDKGSGDQLAEQYRKQGLNMLRERATFPDGSNSVEAGIMDMLDRMQTGRFKVFSHLEQWFQEFRMYHRDENGRIVKVDDDVLSATRYASMMLRFAKTYTPRVAEPRVDPFMPLDRMMGM